MTYQCQGTMYNISIVIITYNRYLLLDKLLQKLFHSPFKKCEIWVLNNDSKDRTLEICEHWRSLFLNLHIVTHKYNIGADANIMRAYEYGIGEYKWILCDDDELNFDYADDLIQALESRQYDMIRLVDKWIEINERGTSSTLVDILENGGTEAFWSFGFVPAIIFRSKMVRAYLQNAYYKIHTHYTQLFVLFGFGKLARVYTTKNPIVKVGSAPTGIGSEVIIYWLQSLEALPTDNSRKTALNCIFADRFRYVRHVVFDRLMGRSRRLLFSLWKQIFCLTPSLKYMFIVGMALPFMILPVSILRVLYRLKNRRPFDESQFKDIKLRNPEYLSK